MSPSWGGRHALVQGGAQSWVGEGSGEGFGAVEMLPAEILLPFVPGKVEAVGDLQIPSKVSTIFVIWLFLLSEFYE